MTRSGETYDEIYAASIDTIRPVLLGLQKEDSIHIYPVTRSLSNIAFKVFDLYAAHHLLGSIEMREMHKGRVLVTYIPKLFPERQVKLGVVPQEILPMFEQFVAAFRDRLRELGIACLRDENGRSLNQASF